eukprot:TRINITY_DN4459_c0_g1_i2.p1 TRINITY_DN4459_c0_g1~~TRINITY_DN4459_c0_g1_i2.p1  ORF type:complete len:174 (-),score=24.67 TRINITY_DN4459_c0_g1_i2:46-567(-)
MWKLKLATKIAGGNIGGKSDTNYRMYARFAGLGTAAAMLVLGGLAIGFNYKSAFSGYYSVAISPFIFILEFPFAPFRFTWPAHDFLADFKFRAAFFAIVSVVSFFDLITLLAGVLCAATGVGYLYCWFKGEKGLTMEELKKPAAPVDLKAAENGQASQETGKKKKFSLASMGI